MLNLQDAVRVGVPVKKTRVLLLVFCLVTLLTAIASNSALAARQGTVAVVLLGSLEFQHKDYYEIVNETLAKPFAEKNYKLIIGDHPQHMFNRFSDKQALLPGAIPPEEKLAEFSWSHSFDRVLFLMFSALSIKSSEITIQWENAEVTVLSRGLSFDSRSRQKIADASTSQTVKMFSRKNAKRAVFRKCLEELRTSMNLP